MDTESNSIQNVENVASADGELSAIDLLADKLLAEKLAGEELSPAPKQQSKTYKHPMAIDLLLAVGLLFAMAGLTVSFVKTYITHSAKTSILQGNYKAAIGILHGSPIPEFFGGAGTDNSEDLLNQALYLDAMEKLDANRDDQTALQELSKVKATQGSYYYDLAQDQFRKLKMQKQQAPATASDASPANPTGERNAEGAGRGDSAGERAARTGQGEAENADSQASRANANPNDEDAPPGASTATGATPISGEGMPNQATGETPNAAANTSAQSSNSSDNQSAPGGNSNNGAGPNGSPADKNSEAAPQQQSSPSTSQ